MYSKSNSVTKEMLNFKRKLQIWVKLLSFALHANMTIKIVSSLKEMMCKEIYIAMMICQFPKKLNKKLAVVLWQVLKFLDKGRFDQFFAYYIFEQVRLSY